ncbi:hypothetical protein [Actinotalea sp. C106]|uniref:hypothetical protein n=1 Tax=Actinotalea sp. C106 TaxID=2908644 RepID=UPI002028FC44|nr:hypothetical protein [Actinotalea sp. C106]
MSPDLDGVPGLPIGEVLPELRIPPLPAASTAAGVLAFVKLHEPSGEIGWAVRVTSDMDDEEVLGLLVGYVEHLKQQAASSWDSTDPTRAED